MTKIEENLKDILKLWETKSAELKKWELMLIEQRYLGSSYKEISENLRMQFPNTELNLTKDYLRKKMYKGGDIREHYDCYCRLMNQESLHLGENAIASSFQTACNTMVSLLHSKFPSSVRLSAAKEIVDRIKGKTKQQITLEDDRDDSESLVDLAREVKKLNEPKADTDNKEDSK
jgi:C-terminal processing protease CtpA/Prc